MLSPPVGLTGRGHWGLLCMQIWRCKIKKHRVKKSAVDEAPL